MPRAKKQEALTDWVNTTEAARIISENSGHTVSADYVRKLINEGKLSYQLIGARLKLIPRAEVEAYKVRQHYPRQAAKEGA